MKEKMIQYKWPILMIALVVLNIGWMIYDKQQKQEGILIEEISIESTDTVEKEQDVYLLDTENDTYIDKHINEQVSNSVESVQEIKTIQSEVAETVKQVPIYICGEVTHEGVYYVAPDAIIDDVIECAGGFTRDADRTVINLASPIRPNEKIIIPKQGQEIDKIEDSYENRERLETLTSSEYNIQSNSVSSTSNEINTRTNSERVNINTATKNELMNLTGIGEVKAEAIIAYRQEQGGFKNIEEIKQISGIGQKTFEKLKQFITT